MSSIAYFIFLCLLKSTIYLFILFITIVIVVKLLCEPIKGVCKCTTKLSGKVALVTGGNSGIGLETAKDLARRGARVIIASRDTIKSKNAVSDIIEETGNTNVEYRHLDLSRFSSVREFAEDFNKTEDRLDILVNNSGIAALKKRITDDNVDVIMQVNYLGPFLLTNLLLDKLIASKPSRIVIVSSLAHIFARFDPEDVAAIKVKGDWTLYCKTKLCNILWAKALSKRLPQGVTVNALHPGIVKTDIFKRVHAVPRKIILSVIQTVFKTAKEGAQTSIHLCVAPELENASGGYYSDCKPSRTSVSAKNEVFIEKLWKESMRLTEK